MASSFLTRHRAPPVLFLPNVWDALSARLFVAAGFNALATTSAGVAWALGYPDGEIAPWNEVVAATARIVRSAGVPVTADIKAGYGATPTEVGTHVADIIHVGVESGSIWRMACTARSAASRMRRRGCLAADLGFTQLPWPQIAWLYGMLALIAIMTIQGIGYLPPTKLRVCIDLQKAVPNHKKSSRMMDKFFTSSRFKALRKSQSSSPMTKFTIEI